MHTSEAPAKVNEPKRPAESSPQSDSPAQDSFASKPISRRKAGPILGLGLTLNASPNATPNPTPSSNPDPGPEPSPAPSPEPDGSRSPVVRSSRWIDYDTHELLEMIGELEDERRWARLREGMLWAILVHAAILFALFLLPRYIKVPNVIDANRNKDHQNFTYLDTPNLPAPKPVKPLPHHPLIDKQTMEQMKRLAPPAPSPPEQQSQAQEQPKPQPSQPIPPNQQSQVQAPRPAAVPAKPNFAMGSQNPADQLREDMQQRHARSTASRTTAIRARAAATMHPGAGTGGAEILSDTQGVDFNTWLARWHYITQLHLGSADSRRSQPAHPESRAWWPIRFKVCPTAR